MNQEYSQHSNNYAQLDMDYGEGNFFSTQYNPSEQIDFQFCSDGLPDEFDKQVINSQIFNLEQKQHINISSIRKNSNQLIFDVFNFPHSPRQEENSYATELQAFEAQGSQKNLGQDNGEAMAWERRDEKPMEKVAQIKKKKDQKKNVYGNSFILIAKTLFSQKYQSFFKKLCQKYGTKKSQIKDFYGKLWNISLSDVRDLLNFKVHQLGSRLRKIKECFYAFYVWFLRHRYSIHILKSKKIRNKQAYFEAKNYLVYISDLIKEEISHKDEE